MAPRYWRCPGGGYIANASGQMKKCENDPCVTGPDLPCCPAGESPGETLTFAWGSSTYSGNPGPGGSATLFYNAVSQSYEGMYDDPNISDSFLVDIGCTGAADGREFDISGGGAAASGGSDTTASCTTFLLEFGTLAATGDHSTLHDVTVSN